jgi:hypothetical protein
MAGYAGGYLTPAQDAALAAILDSYRAAVGAA